MEGRLLRLHLVVWPLVLASQGCGRTEPTWWSDIYASGSDEADASSGDASSGSESTSGPGTSTVAPETTSDPDITSDPDTSSTDPDTTTDTTSDPTTDTTTTACEPAMVALVAAPPTVVLLVEQGAHMSQDIGTGLSIWDTVGLALFDADLGVVPTWEAELRLGLTGFTSQNGNQGGSCPLLAELAPTLANASAMQTAWAAMMPIDENPVGDALAAAGPSLVADPSPGSKAIALLSARNPDTCAQPNPQQGANAAIAAANAASGVGITTRLFALGNLNQNYAQALADAGAGQAGATWTSAGDELELAAALDAWLRTLRPCQLALDPVIAPMGADACLLTLAGEALQLDDPHGFVIEKGTTLTLQGSACTDYQALGPAALELICSCDAF